MNYLQAEHLKNKRTFAKKLIVLAPVVTVLMNIFAPLWFQLNSYNWWYILLYPGFLTLVCAMLEQRDNGKLKYQAVLTLPEKQNFVALLVYLIPNQLQLDKWSQQTLSSNISEKLRKYVETFSKYSCITKQNESGFSFIFATTLSEEETLDVVQSFLNYLYHDNTESSLSILFGFSPALKDLPDSYQELEKLSHQMLVPKPGVYRQSSTPQEILGTLPSTQAWCDCFTNKTTHFIQESIQSCVQRNIEKGTMNRLTLSALQQEFLYSFQQSLQKRSLSFGKIMNDQELMMGLALSLHSVKDFKRFVNLIIETNQHLIDNLSEEPENSVALAQAYIAKHLSENDLSRGTIARAAHISESHLSRLFSKEIGVSISDYINDERLKLAKSLLIDTTMSVTLVSVKSGFNSTSYFITNFKKNVGMTPTEYRKKLKNGHVKNFSQKNL